MTRCVPSLLILPVSLKAYTVLVLNDLWSHWTRSMQTVRVTSDNKNKQKAKGKPQIYI
jgi:hypothetical protein